MSEVRGDGRFNPVPIPDLAARQSLRVPGKEPELRDFIEQIIVGEFMGSPPPKMAVDGLTAYVSAMARSSCQPSDPASEPVTISADFENVRRAIRAAQFANRRGDQESARLMIASARWGLFLIDQRFSDGDLAPAQTMIRSLGRRLGGLATTSGSDMAAGLLRSFEEIALLEARISPLVDRTFYSPARLVALKHQCTGLRC